MADSVTGRAGVEVPFYLSISGNIGVGKSTLCRQVGEALGWPTYYEPVDDNPYLEDYYRDMPRWAFHLQIYFLSKRFEVQKDIIQHGRSAVQDRTIYEDVEIFAPVLHRRGAMDTRDYENYREVFRNMVSFLRPPDLILYLRCAPETALARIAARGRECEKTIPADFIADLHAAYEAWIPRATDICPVHTVDTDRVDLRDPDAFAELLALIRRHHADKQRAAREVGS